MIFMIYAAKTLTNHSHHKNLRSNKIQIQELPNSEYCCGVIRSNKKRLDGKFI